MSIRKHLSQPWFDLVKNGKKTYEGRIREGNLVDLKVGDKITFFCEAKEELEYELIELVSSSPLKKPELKIGDKITYTKEFMDEIVVEVTEVIISSNFKDAIKKVGLEKVLPSVPFEEPMLVAQRQQPIEADKTVDDAVNDMCCGCYSKVFEEYYGIVMFGMKVIEK